MNGAGRVRPRVPAHRVVNRNGLLSGNAEFFFKQLAAVLMSSVWAFAFTYGMLWLIDRVTAVRVTAEVEETGLDSGLHGEEAYVGAL